MAVPEVGVAHWLPLADVADLYPAILEKRRWIQSGVAEAMLNHAAVSDVLFPELSTTPATTAA